MEALHVGNALTDLGRALVSELNRLGGECQTVASLIVILLMLSSLD